MKRLEFAKHQAEEAKVVGQLYPEAAVYGSSLFTVESR